jgi:hypothetical protein
MRLFCLIILKGSEYKPKPATSISRLTTTLSFLLTSTESLSPILQYALPRTRKVVIKVLFFLIQFLLIYNLPMFVHFGYLVNVLRVVQALWVLPASAGSPYGPRSSGHCLRSLLGVVSELVRF